MLPIRLRRRRPLLSGHSVRFCRSALVGHVASSPGCLVWACVLAIGRSRREGRSWFRALGAGNYFVATANTSRRSFRAGDAARTWTSGTDGHGNSMPAHGGDEVESQWDPVANESAVRREAELRDTQDGHGALNFGACEGVNDAARVTRSDSSKVIPKGG